MSSEKGKEHVTPEEEEEGEEKDRAQWRSLRLPRGSKTYIPKNFYTKTTYITLLSEKFGGQAPPSPLIAAPLNRLIAIMMYV
ncbi:hypothetical protein Hanom_Chr14g01279181 [Helianthus anomalus]